MWTFEVVSWRGALQPNDPDGFVSEAGFVQVADAIVCLEANPWQSLTVKYLRGQLESGSLHLQRWYPDGRVEVVASVGTSG